MEMRSRRSARVHAKRCTEPPGQQLRSFSQTGRGNAQPARRLNLSRSVEVRISLCVCLLILFLASLQAQQEILHLKQQLGAQNAELKRSLAAQDVQKISWEEARKAERLLWEKARHDERQSWEREQENLQRKQRQLHVRFCASVHALG